MEGNIIRYLNIIIYNASPELNVLKYKFRILSKKLPRDILVNPMFNKYWHLKLQLGIIDKVIILLF